MSGPDLAALLVELVACGAVPQPQGTLREMAFRKDAWSGAETERLRELFASDVAVDEIARLLGRGRAGVADRIGLLGLRRNSATPWSKLEDEELARRYGVEATASLASALGRSCAAVYARAGLVGLTEAVAPPWTAWEDAQLRAGYAAGVPVAQLATLVGRALGGIACRASALGIVHANQPPGWTEAEARRALELAEAGHRYRAILDIMRGEGFPERTLAGFGPVVRRLGYGRGWGRPWCPEEDALLVRAYADGASLTPLRTRLGRTAHSIRWRAEYLKLRGTHAHRHGFRGGPDWTEADQALLRAEYGRTPNAELAAKLGRTKAAMFTRANLLGLVHGYIRPFSAEETRALQRAFDTGVAIADLAAALGRKACSVSKYATVHGFRFGRRPRRPGISLADLLEPDAAEPRTTTPASGAGWKGKAVRAARSAQPADPAGGRPEAGGAKAASRSKRLRVRRRQRGLPRLAGLASRRRRR